MSKGKGVTCMTFGKYLKKVRNNKGITARELGIRVNTTGQYITQTEQGKLKAPNRVMAFKLAEELEVNPAEMWGIAALERYKEWCVREGIDPDNAHTFFQAAMFDRKKAGQKLARY